MTLFVRTLLNQTKFQIVHKHLQTAITITNKQPDIFNDKCLSICIRLINTQQESKIHCAALKFIEKACYMHEINRQNIMNADILSFLKPLLKSDDANVVRQTCAVLRYLIMDDDIRVEFGKAHEHARTIATESLSDLTKLLTSMSNIFSFKFHFLKFISFKQSLKTIKILFVI